LASLDLTDTAMGWVCCIGWGVVADRGEGEADHPAEAIVLACLRAVGVAKEELV
jgi:hypothetical protein